VQSPDKQIVLWDVSSPLRGFSAIAACRWTACSGPALLWRSWDDEQWIVYQVASGDTHLLNHVAAQALRSLQEHPATVSQLAERVAAALGAVADEAFTRELERLVAEFDELGLIERSP